MYVEYMYAMHVYVCYACEVIYVLKLCKPFLLPKDAYKIITHVLSKQFMNDTPT